MFSFRRKNVSLRQQLGLTELKIRFNYSQCLQSNLGLNKVQETVTPRCPTKAGIHLSP